MIKPVLDKMNLLFFACRKGTISVNIRHRHTWRWSLKLRLLLSLPVFFQWQLSGWLGWPFKDRQIWNKYFIKSNNPKFHVHIKLLILVFPFYILYSSCSWAPHFMKMTLCTGVNTSLQCKPRCKRTAQEYRRHWDTTSAIRLQSTKCKMKIFIWPPLTLQFPSNYSWCHRMFWYIYS